MTTRAQQIVWWIPRVLGILYGVFLSLFSFDVFGGPEPFIEQLLGFFIHLAPVYGIALAVFVSWKWRYGGVSFIVLAVGFLVAFGAWEHPISAMLLAGIPMLIGVLFLLAFRFRQSSAE